jgi:hypothetical protein
MHESYARPSLSLFLSAGHVWVILDLRIVSERRAGATWCRLVYAEAMPPMERAVRQSVTLPSRVARRIRALPKSQSTSASRVIAGLIQTGLESVDQERKHFFALTDRLVSSSDPAEKRQISPEDLYALLRWRKTEPEAPDGPW